MHWVCLPWIIFFYPLNCPSWVARSFYLKATKTSPYIPKYHWKVHEIVRSTPKVYYQNLFEKCWQVYCFWKRLKSIAAILLMHFWRKILFWVKFHTPKLIHLPIILFLLLFLKWCACVCVLNNFFFIQALFKKKI